MILGPVHHGLRPAHPELICEAPTSSFSWRINSNQRCILLIDLGGYVVCSLTGEFFRMGRGFAEEVVLACSHGRGFSLMCMYWLASLLACHPPCLLACLLAYLGVLTWLHACHTVLVLACLGVLVLRTGLWRAGGGGSTERTVAESGFQPFRYCCYKLLSVCFAGTLLVLPAADSRLHTATCNFSQPYFFYMTCSYVLHAALECTSSYLCEYRCCALPQAATPPLGRALFAVPGCT
eukprot:1158868-Pelagomonas_calceolata.AAC.3